MQNIELALTLFFERVARREAEELRRLYAYPAFALDPDRWRFALPDLFAYLQAHDEAFGGIDYRRFRRALLNSPVNRAIRRFGAEIAITDNRGKVDRSTYALIWHSGNSTDSRATGPASDQQ